MIKKTELSLTESIKRAEDIQALHTRIEEQDDIIYKHTQNLTLLNDGLAMALATLRRLQGKINPDE